MITISNPGKLDVLALQLHGLSVKDSPTAIGRFGTGLKYAIAVILRNGGELEILIGKDSYTFHIVERDFRGKAVQQIVAHCNGEPAFPLSITPEYGKNWAPWQALREILSNALDEGGAPGLRTDSETIFLITGEVFDRAWARRADWYLDGVEEQALSDKVAIVPGPAGAVFYQGFRVGDLPDTTFAFSIRNRQISLTEDRTLSSQYDIYREIGSAMFGSPAAYRHLVRQPEAFLSRVVMVTPVPKDPAMLKIMQEPGTPVCIRHMAQSALQERWLFTPVPLSPSQQRMFKRACDYVRHLVPFEAEEIQFTNDLSRSKGLYVSESGAIWISLDEIDSTLDLAATIYEELVHKRHNLRDETRELQDYLLRQLFKQLEIQHG